MKEKIKKFFDNGFHGFLFMMFGLLLAIPISFKWGLDAAQLSQIITLMLAVPWAAWLHRKKGFLAVFR